jgi:aldehyde dehydrogenase (NAD+)
MLAWKIAPALAAGNTVVLKPAEFTPLTAFAFAAICVETGLPPGVVNIVTGDGATGAALVEHDGVDKIAFTGSTEVGRTIRKATAGTGKKLSLELGGKSPFVVFEDADLDSAVEGVVDAIWLNQGQVCCAGSRLLVAESVAEAMYAKLRARMARLRVGDPLDKSTDIGAIVAPVQLERIKRLMREGEREGLEFFRADDMVPDRGCFYPPTLVIGVEPASVLAREEIFGPVLVATTFRTPDEAVALANNTRYGLAASVWTENVNRALEVGARIKAGVVWINSTNMFDAAAGFGGYRESGFGREGGREGLYEYRIADAPKGKPSSAKAPRLDASPGLNPARNIADGAPDRTAKLFIGGKQARSDSGYSSAVLDPTGRELGLAGLGNRKDIRNAVEAAAKATSWGAATAHNRAQVLYYVAENLSARADEFARRLSVMTGASARAAKAEVEASIRRAFVYAGYADKFDGAVHATRSRFVTLAMNEPWGVMGILCPNEAPLLAFVSLVMPAIAMGNCVVVVPSAAHPLSATDFYSVLETSDLPAGVVNIVTGEANALAKTLAEHDGVDALWFVGDADGAAQVEALSAGNLKATWTSAAAVDWDKTLGREFLRRATQVKNIWTPYGE